MCYIYRDIIYITSRNWRKQLHTVSICEMDRKISINEIYDIHVQVNDFNESRTIGNLLVEILYGKVQNHLTGRLICLFTRRSLFMKFKIII